VTKQSRYGDLGQLANGAFKPRCCARPRGWRQKECRLRFTPICPSIPPYDDDIRLAGHPPPVAALRDRVRAADALIFATPEYSRSFPGVLKNAIDWVSRPPAQPLDGKPAPVTGAGPGALGTALANYHLRQVLSVLNVHVVPGLEVLVGGVASKFDDQGRLLDLPTCELLAKSLVTLMRF
jgi:chromate reductase, NAD(P)H dehydrogenase (quinone)